MRVATWNINSVGARLPRLLEWLDGAAPDVLCLQELKCAADAFPYEAVQDLGYQVAAHGDGRPLEDRKPRQPHAHRVDGVEQHVGVAGELDQLLPQVVPLRRLRRAAAAVLPKPWPPGCRRGASTRVIASPS